MAKKESQATSQGNGPGLSEVFQKNFFYSIKLKTWYQWKETHWTTIDQIEMKKHILQELRQREPEEPTVREINECYNKFRIELGKTEHKAKDSHINFLNGVWDINKNKLIPHDRSFFFTHLVNVNYDKEAQPTEKVKKLLLSFVGGNKLVLQLLRGAIRRSLEPSSAFQTGFWIYGPPGTGKSTFVSWLRQLIPDRAVELSCAKLNNPFERAQLRGSSMAVISDGESINLETIRLLKSITGRDEISYALKHENVSNACFSCVAVVFVTSNLSLSEGVSTTFDRALCDRFFEIYFGTVPKKSQAGLKNFLVENTSAIVNWALHVPKNILELQIRVGTDGVGSLEESLYIDFLTSQLAIDPNGFISNADLLELCDKFLKENGLPSLVRSARRKTPNVLRDLLSSVCLCKVKVGRQKDRRGTKGVRIVENVNDKRVSLPPSGRKIDLPEDDFLCERIVSYTELDSTFELQEERNSQKLDPSADPCESLNLTKLPPKVDAVAEDGAGAGDGDGPTATPLLRRRRLPPHKGEGASDCKQTSGDEGG